MEHILKDELLLESIYLGVDQAISIMEVTPAGELIFLGINPAFERITGFGGEAVQGKTPYQLVPDLPSGTAEKITQFHLECLEMGERVEFRQALSFGKSSGQWFMRLQPVGGSDGTTRRIVFTISPLSTASEKLVKATEKYLDHLDASEKRFRSIMENFQGIAYRLDHYRVPVYLLGNVEQLTGYSESDFKAGKADWTELIREEDRDRVMKEFPDQKIKKEGFQCTREYRIRRKNGRYVWVSDFSRVVLDREENRYYIQGVIQDLSPWKKVEATIRKNEARSVRLAEEAQMKSRLLEGNQQWFNLITEANLAGFWDWDLEQGKARLNSPTIAQMVNGLNLQPEEFTGLNERIHPDDREEAIQLYQNYLENPVGQLEATYRVLNDDREYRWVTCRASAKLDSKSRVSRIIGVQIDVTDQMETRKKLLESEEKYRRLFEHAGDMIFILGPDGRIEDANHQAYEKLGAQEGQLKGKAFPELSDGEHRENTVQILEKITGDQKPEEFTTRMRSLTGKILDVQVSATPEITEGSLHSIYAIVRDMTILNRTSRELTHVNQQLLEKNKELEQIVYVTSHDLRSPLVNIQGFNQELVFSMQELTKLIDQASLPADLKDEVEMIIHQEVPESLDYIRNGIGKMDLLLKGLLVISRLGRRPLRLKCIDMNRMAEEIIKSFHFQIKELEIDVRIDPLPDCRADLSQLTQVVQNLVDNAIKFRHPERKCAIRISGVRRSGMVEYSVSDNGIGIPEDKYEKIFEIFHKHEPGKSGEGLGLTIVRKIIEKHHGSVRVESKHGQGSRFIFSLPDLKKDKDGKP